MQHANPTSQNREVAMVAIAPAPQNEGFIEVAILSLIGLAFTLIMIAQGIFPDAAIMIVQ